MTGSNRRHLLVAVVALTFYYSNMRESVEQVLSLRKQGKTYTEIASATGRSKATISWVCKKYMSEESRLIHAENRAKAWKLHKNEHLTNMGRAAAKHYANKKAERTNYWVGRMAELDPAMTYYIAGLYDGEGNHYGTEFNMSNSDKTLIFRFMSFLQAIGASYTATLMLHKSHNRDKCEKWWGIKLDYVYIKDTRPQKRVDLNNVRENYGTVKIRALRSNGMSNALRLVTQKLVADDGFDPSTSACNAEMIASSPIGS